MFSTLKNITRRNFIKNLALVTTGAALTVKSPYVWAKTKNPSSFDLYEQWSDSMNVLWRANAIHPIETDRLTHWNEINNLTKTGKITEGAKIGAGDAPHKLLFVQDDQLPSLCSQH